MVYLKNRLPKVYLYYKFSHFCILNIPIDRNFNKNPLNLKYYFICQSKPALPETFRILKEKIRFHKDIKKLFAIAF